jgi:hypothetical protein
MGFFHHYHYFLTTTTTTAQLMTRCWLKKKNCTYIWDTFTRSAEWTLLYLCKWSLLLLFGVQLLLSFSFEIIVITINCLECAIAAMQPLLRFFHKTFKLIIYYLSLLWYIKSSHDGQLNKPLSISFWVSYPPVFVSCLVFFYLLLLWWYVQLSFVNSFFFSFLISFWVNAKKKGIGEPLLRLFRSNTTTTTLSLPLTHWYI